MQGARLLVVEPDSERAQMVVGAADAVRADCTRCGSGSEAIRHAESDELDVIVSSITLPDMRGISLCQRLRDLTDAGILLTGVEEQSFDLVVGLEVGADDAVRLPIGARELQARLRALWRRVRASRGRREGFLLNDPGQPISLDAAHRSVRIDGQQVNLTPNEFRIMAALMTKPGTTVPADDLAALMGASPDSDIASRRKQVWIYMGRLRNKIESDSRRPRHILTVRGKGYRLIMGRG